MKALVCAALLALAACSTLQPQGESRAKLFHNGTIYLGYPDWRAVEALAVVDGRVVAAGTIDEVYDFAPGGERIDLAGAVVLPGLQDAHGHIEGLGKALETVDLRGAVSFDEIIERVVAQAAKQPAGTWIEGRGWDQNLWPEKEFPHHQRLSERTPEHPVFLRRVDGHAGLANAQALAVAGLDGAREVPGGEVMLDTAGAPTGVLVDAAMGLVGGAIPAPEPATRERRLLAAQDALLAVGLTCVHDMGVDPWTVALLERMHAQGRWKLRTCAYLSMGTGTQAADLRGFPRGPDADDVVWARGVKLYIDGALGSRGAALLADYTDRPGSRGLLLTEPEEFERLIGLCSDLELQPATHAIGDRAGRIVLDTYARALSRRGDFDGLRPRVEHAQVVSPQDWQRFEELNVVPSMQPTHCTSDMGWAVERLGSERARGAYAWRRVLRDPARIAGGSDFPVERENPLLGVYAAITRQDEDGNPPGGFFPGQRLDAREALGTFTYGAARAVGQSDRRGRLAPGCAADMTVLDVDPLTCAPAQLLGAHVQMTVINGAIVYRAP